MFKIKMWLKYDTIYICYIKNEKERYKKPPCGKNLLQNLHGQFSGFYSFIFSLNFSSMLLFFMWSGTVLQIVGPKKVKDSVPLDTVL